jgi:predicted nucleotidyltransferase
MNFDLRRHTILLTLSGSRAYGLHTDTSDVDVKGVCVPPKACYLGTQRFEQQDSTTVVREAFMPGKAGNRPDLYAAATAHGMEGTVYEVRKFVSLAAGANPNILDTLFCRDEDVLFAKPEGQLLREHRHRFLTKKCLQTFLGYAKAQLDKIETHRGYLLNKPTHQPTREEFHLPARSEIPQDQMMTAMAAIKQKVDGWNIDFGDLDEATKIYIQDQMYSMLTEMHLGRDERFQIAGKLLGYDTNFMQLLQQQRLYDAALKRWQAFKTWERERNPERAGMEAAIGYDAKHGMHLARLLVACRTIFETGSLSVYNPDPFLMDVRHCRVPYADLMAWHTAQREGLAELASKSSLPTRVDADWLNDLTLAIVDLALSRNG